MNSKWGRYLCWMTETEQVSTSVKIVCSSQVKGKKGRRGMNKLEESAPRPIFFHHPLRINLASCSSICAHSKTDSNPWCHSEKTPQTFQSLKPGSILTSVSDTHDPGCWAEAPICPQWPEVYREAERRSIKMRLCLQKAQQSGQFILKYLVPNGFDLLHGIKKQPLCSFPAERDDET